MSSYPGCLSFLGPMLSIYYLSYQSLLFQHPPRKCVRILHIPAAITSCSDVLPGHHPTGNSRLPWNDKLVATDPLLVPASRRDHHAIDALGNKTLDDWLLQFAGFGNFCPLPKLSTPLLNIAPILPKSHSPLLISGLQKGFYSIFSTHPRETLWCSHCQVW